MKIGRQERIGIIVIAGALLLLNVGLWLFRPSPTPNSALRAPQPPKGEKPPYPLKGRKISNLKSQSPHPFDPNTADSATFVELGLRPRVARAIVNYRRAGGIFRRPEDFARIYTLSDSDYRRLLPYIYIKHKAPRPTKGEEKGYRLEVSGYRSHVRKPKSEPQACQSNLSRRRVREPQACPSNNKGIKLHAGETIDLSSADTTQLKKIPGIGSYYAGKIVRYRSRLGGFVSLSQLKEISGLPEDIAAWVTLDNTPVTQLHINQLTFGELLKHPYLNFEQVRAIIDHRRHYGPVSSFSDLQTYPAFSAADFERLKPYIAFD